MSVWVCRKAGSSFGLDTLELVLDGQEQDYGVFDNSVGVALLAGYNVQLDQLVLGGELEVDLLGPASLGTYDIDTGDFENAFATCSYGADPACAEFSVLGALDMKGRLRVTAGMEVTPGLMVFLSGGLSVADASVAGYKVFAETPIPPRGDALSSPVTERLIGGNIGVGGQVALNQNISLRGEVIYDAFGEVPYYMNTGSSVTGSSVSAATDSVSFSQLSARASLIWKF